MSVHDINTKSVEETGKTVEVEESSSPLESVNAIVNTQLENANNITAAARHNITKAGVLVWSTVKNPITEAIQVIRDANSKSGTPLRKAITDARLAANNTFVSVEDSVKEAETSLEKSLTPVKDAFVVAQENAIKFNTFRKAYPAVVVGGAALIFGIPTLLLRGKARGLFNSLTAAGITAGAMYGADEWEKIQQQ